MGATAPPGRRLAALAAAAALASGCGGPGRSEPPPGPRLPRELGRRLAEHADGVAAALRAGDCAGASRLARALQRETIDAINARRVPRALLEDLQVGVNVLVDDIRCPAPAPPGEEGDGKGKQKHGGKGEERGGEGDG